MKLDISECTKEQIARQTFKLMLIKGVDAVSITDIKQATGIARGLLYHYFGSKEALYEYCTEKYLLSAFEVDFNRATKNGLLDMIDQIVTIYKNLCYGYGEDVTIAQFDILIYSMTTRNDNIKIKIDEVFIQEEEAWRIAALNSISAGEIRNDIDASTIASFMVCITDGVWMQTYKRIKKSSLLNRLEEMMTTYYNLIKK